MHIIFNSVHQWPGRLGFNFLEVKAMKRYSML